MRGRVLTGMLALAAATALPAAALACSMPREYKVPTNLELAAEADTIVVATITGERLGEQGWDGVVLTRPTLLLKGKALPAAVQVPGASLATGKLANAWVDLSEPRELRRPNRGALSGGCVRYIFKPDMQLVLFLKLDASGALMPYRASFSRDAEDVSGPQALWVKAVREYAAVSEAPRSTWTARLASRAAELRATPGDVDALAIADDMDIERSGGRLFNRD